MATTLHRLVRLWFAASLALALSAGHAESPKPPVLIGLDAEFGHPTSTSDDAIKMGILTAIDEINGKGGVLGGRPLKLVETDSRSVPSRGTENYRTLAAMPDLVGVFVGKFSPVAMEQARIAGELKIPLLDPWAAADDIISDPAKGTYTFRLSLRDSWAVPVMLDYLIARKKKRIGVLLPTSSWGRSNEKNIRQYAEKQRDKVEIAGIKWYDWGIATLAAQLDELRSAGADAILFAGNEVEGKLLLAELARKPVEQRLLVASHWGVAGGDLVEMAGDNLARVDFAVVQTFTFVGRKDARSEQVVRRAGQLFKLAGSADIPSQVGFAHAYDLTHILARAIDLAGGTAGPAVRDALERVQRYDGLIQRYEQPFSSSSHEALRPSLVFMGRFRPDGQIERIAESR